MWPYVGGLPMIDISRHASGHQPGGDECPGKGLERPLSAAAIRKRGGRLTPCLPRTGPRPYPGGMASGVFLDGRRAFSTSATLDGLILSTTVYKLNLLENVRPPYKALQRLLCQLRTISAPPPIHRRRQPSNRLGSGDIVSPGQHRLRSTGR